MANNAGLLGGGADLGTLDAIMSRFTPSPQEEAARRQQAWLIAFLASLQSRKGHQAEALGNAGLMGLSAYGQMGASAQDAALKRMQMTKEAMGLAQAVQSTREQQMRQGIQNDPTVLAILAGQRQNVVQGPEQSFMSPGGATGLLAGATGQETPPPQMLPTQTQVPMSADDQMVAALRQMQKVAAERNRGDLAAEYAMQASKLAPKDEVFKVEYGEDKDHKPVTLVVMKSGRPVTLPGFYQREEIEYLNAGGALLPRGKYSGLRSDMPAVPVTMSPSEADTSARGWTGLGFERQRLGLEGQRVGLEKQKFEWDKSKPQDLGLSQPNEYADASGKPFLGVTSKTRPGIFKADTLEPVPGAQPKAPTPSDLQERAGVSSRVMENADKVINDLAEKGFTGTGMSGVTASMAEARGIPYTPTGPVLRAAGSLLSGGEADQFNQAREQFVQGVQLYQQRTGAASPLTREQIMRIYIPSTHDDAKTEANKKQARKDIIGLIRSAGTRTATAPQAPAATPDKIKSLLDKYAPVR